MSSSTTEEETKSEAKRLSYSLWYTKNRIEILQKNTAYAKQHRERMRLYQKRYRDAHKQQMSEYLKRRHEENPNREKSRSRNTREKIRESVFNIIGKKCAVCGFADIRALQFDHIDGGGKFDRQNRPQSLGYSQLRFFRDNPQITKKRLQTLCANCNQIKRHFRGENYKPAKYSDLDSIST